MLGHKGRETKDQELLSVRMSVAADRPIFMSLVGELDMASAPFVSAIVEWLVDEEARHVVVDAQEVGFCDAAGLRALIVAHRRVEIIGSLFAIVPSQSIRRLTALLGLDKKLFLFPTLPTALKATKAKQQGTNGNDNGGGGFDLGRTHRGREADLNDAPWAYMT